jgi:membrane-associated phospholipid phosphatase
MVTTYASQPPGERGSGTLRRSAMYAEALVLAQGLTSVLKNSTSRPRPYAYLPAERRWDEPAYDVTADAAFQSMPSGHSSLAFCAASFAMTDNLISRPRARWVERVGVPFVGGALAGMTAAMRVEGGVHFPSDVIAGGLIGTSCGVAVPLLHRYFDAGGRTAPRPSARAWGEAIAGLLAGVGAGILAADAVY